MKKKEKFATIWDVVADTPEEAANSSARSELMQEITEIIEKCGWTQTAAAKRCGITQRRMSDLLNGRVSRFSLDALVNIATALGHRVHFVLETVQSARS
jgi:predicted XRE-type DNA-binding protein